MNRFLRPLGTALAIWLLALLPGHAQEQTDLRAAAQTLDSTSSNAAYTVHLNNGRGVLTFAVSGLTAAGATLTIEGSADGRTTWSPINGIAPATGVLFTTLTADQQFRVMSAGWTDVRLRVSATGSGTITIASDASGPPAGVMFGAPLPAGGNIVGKVGIDQTTPGTTNGVQVNAALPAGSNVIGHVIVDTTSTTAVTQATAGNLNATVVGTGTFAVQAAQSGNYTARIVGNGGATLDATVAPGTAPANMQVSGGIYNATPAAPTDTQSLALQLDETGRLRTTAQPAVANKVTGTASQATGGTSTSLIALVSAKRIYVVGFSCANTGVTASLISFQDGSGGTTLWTTIVPAGGGSNLDGNTPLFWTTAGTALYFVPASSSTTVYCSAAGFSGS